MRRAACLAFAAALSAPAAAEPPWRGTLERLAATRDSLSSRLEAVHRSLKARVEAERPDLLPRIAPPPPKPLPSGYGLLPELQADDPGPPSQTPTETRYDLPGLEEWIARESSFTDAAAVAVSSGTADLAGVVDLYLLRRENFSRIDQHVQYHHLWQAEIARDPEAFAPVNALLGTYRAWRAAQGSGDAEHERRERVILEREAVAFSSVPWHRIDRSDPGPVLRLTLMTDVTDDAFLLSVSSRVEAAFNDSPAARERGLRFQLSWRRLRPEALYPEGVPARGSALDLAAHLGRFGPGYLMTTGGATLHLLGGRAIVLGPHPVTPRALLHELAHILGFRDGYFRAFEGSPADPYGVSIWEINPFPFDLMADPRRGVLTPVMVQRLLEAY